VNNIVEEFILDNGGTPSFKNYNGFPFATCISINEAVVHGFPGEHEPSKEGDIISLDIGVYKNGFHGDSAYTYAIGEISAEIKQLLKVTKESLYLGIEKQGRKPHRRYCECHTGTYRKKHGYGVVRELVGHGLGRKLHEDPQVPNYGKKGTGAKLKAGMVLAIEPMIKPGSKRCSEPDDGWTILTRDNKFSAHFEHDVCITKGDPDILSSFEIIEAAEKANPNLDWSYEKSAILV
jgi:methionyl aminopeptidase